MEVLNKVDEKYFPELNKMKKETLQEPKDNKFTKGAKEFVDNTSNKLSDYSDEQTRKMQEKIDTIENPVTKKVAELNTSIGNNFVGAGLSAINPALGATYFMTSAAGSYENEAIKRGATDEQAYLYGSALGVAEGATEMLGVSQLLKGTKALGKGAIKESINAYGINVADNFIQEAAMEPIQEGANELILGDSDWDGMFNRMITSGIDGALSALILDGASSGIGTCVNVVNKINNNESITQKDIDNAKNDLNTVVSELGKEIEKNPTNETAQNYIYEKSDNVKIDNLRKDASKYWNNSEQTKNYIGMLEKIVQDKDVEIRLDENLKDENGNVANGSYVNGIITINPNSSRTGEFIAIHELTHAIGTKQMRNMIENYRKSNAEFNSAVENLLKNYNANEITDEALADVSAQLFGNQEFINNLSQNNPSLFKRIYNEIKYLWHQFTGYKNQNQFINDLQYKWEQAYRNNQVNIDSSAKYDIKRVANFNEKEYNNATELQLGKQEYAILSSIINSDSNIKPGVNYVEVTNGRYGIYYKGNGEFKVLLKEKDEDAGRLSERTDTTGRKRRYSKPYRQGIEDTTSTASDDEIFNINKERGSKRSGSDASSSKIIRNEELEKSSSFSLSEDNQGRTLTKEQQEYFKDSKVRDEKGRLLEVYHGTPNAGFTIYDKNKLGETTKAKDSTLGIHLTDNIYLADDIRGFKTEKLQEEARKEIYKKYNINDNETLPPNMNKKILQEIDNLIENKASKQGEVKKQYIDIKKPFSIYADYGISNEQLANDLAYILTGENDITETEIGEIYDDNQDFLTMIQQDYDGAIAQLKDELGTNKKMQDRLKELGYDGIILPLQNVDKTELIKKLYNDGKTFKSAKELVRGNEYIVFNSNQIKNVDNINPTSSDDIRYLKDTDKWQEYLDKNYKSTGTKTNLPEIKKAVNSAIAPLQETIKDLKEQVQTMKETIAPVQTKEDTSENTPIEDEESKIAEILSENPNQKNSKQRIWAKTRAALFDKGSVFEDLSIKTKNRELMAKWDYMLTSNSRAQNVMLEGTKKFNPKTKIQEQISKSLNDIWTPIENSDKVKMFTEYLYHKHNISRMTLEERFKIDNKPVFGKKVTADISQKKVDEYENNNPEFVEWAEDIYAYNKANLEQLIDSGVISRETAEKFDEMYPYYVPITRDRNRGNAINVPLDTGRTGINAPLKKARGGNRDILPLKDTMAQRTLQTYKAVAKNNFGVELKNTLNSVIDNKQTNVDEILDNIDEQDNLLKEGDKYNSPTFTVFENGEKVTYEITEDMYNALKPVSQDSLLGTTNKFLNKASNIQRGLLTEYNPVFMLTNSIKDAQDILLNSQHAAKTYSKLGESYIQILKKGYWYKEYMANGGNQNSYFNNQDGTFEVAPTGISKVLKYSPLRVISEINNVIELSPRLAEYIASRESGRSVETSMLDAARVTTNFKAGGDVSKFFNRNGATFLNASIQGAMQQVRNVREANMNGIKGYANLAVKFALASVPGIILNSMVWGDDEDYEELSDYVKQNYYIVGKYGDGKFIRIPKGRMVTIIQEGLNQMQNLITGDDEADLGQFLDIVSNNLIPNNPVEDNVFAPIAQAVSNKTWYGDDLIPTRLQNEPIEEQYDESTDKLSIFLGQKLGISPYKINYVLDQYSGGVGDVLLPMITQQAENGSGTIGEKLIAPLTDKFSVDSVMKNQNVSDLYAESEKLTQKAKSTAATDEEILQNKYINSIKAEMNLLYKEKRNIQSGDLPDDEKYKQVREIQEQINNMAKNGLKNYKEIVVTENYASVGEKEYYKKDDAWEKIDDNELEKLNNMNLTSHEKSDYFGSKINISNIVKEYDERKEDLVNNYGKNSEEYEQISNSLSTDRKKEIIQVITNSGLEDKQKAFLYSKYYSSEETLNTIVNSGIPFDTYLDYESQEIEADVNKKGKTISGSKKKKVISYINSLDLTIPQKAIMIRKEYSSFDDYNVEIIQYVSNLNIVQSEKIAILEDLDMKVDSNGIVRW